MKLVERALRDLQVRFTRDWRLVPSASHRAEDAGRLLVVAARPSPSVDYYLGDLLRGEPERARLVFDDQVERFLGPAPRDVIQAGTRVVLVRMPSSRWASVLRAAEQRLTQVVWLLDDDVLAAREDDSLPKDYRLRLLSDYARFKRDFEQLVDRIWASTPQIASRFEESRTEVRPPRLFASSNAERSWVTIFYHGTASHRQEHAFLRPIFELVQARLQHTLIEVTGDHALYRAYRGIPRLRVLHPLPWPDYLAHLQAGSYQIGLAPLLDSPFNRGRSGLKALQIAELGAQGVLSRRAPYVEHAQLAGLHLVGDEPAEWVERIVSLAETLRRGE